MMAEKHKEFGRIPQYLSDVKRKIQEEENYIQKVNAQAATKKRMGTAQIQLLSEEERLDLLDKLKDKWEKINYEYQLMTHHVNLDTRNKIRKLCL